MDKLNLFESTLLSMLSSQMYEVIREYFEKDKTFYYSTKLVYPVRNGKFGLEGGSYVKSTGKLTITISPPSSAVDIGKIVTFFDATTGNMFAGIIIDYAPGVSPAYIIDTFDDINNIASVKWVTVGDWLWSGDVILLNKHKLITIDDLDIYDVTNSEKINIIEPCEFGIRSDGIFYRDSASRWAKIENDAIRFGSGSTAPAMGVLIISGYWLPPKIMSMDTKVPMPDIRINLLSDRLVNILLAAKKGEPMLSGAAAIEFRADAEKDKKPECKV